MKEYAFLHCFDAGRYAPGYLRLGLSEDQVVSGIVRRLQARGAEVDVVDVGAKQLRGRAVAALRRRGVRCPESVLLGSAGAGKRGAADVRFVLPGGRAGFIEAKKPGLWVEGMRGRLVQELAPGQPTEEQLEYLASRSRLGAVVGVAWSWTDVDLIFSDFAARAAAAEGAR